jgi:hypothetical protein
LVVGLAEPVEEDDVHPGAGAALDPIHKKPEMFPVQAPGGSLKIAV